MNPLDFMNPFSGQIKQFEKAASDIQKSQFYEVFYPFFNVTPISLIRRLSLLFMPMFSYPKRSAGLELDLYLPLLSYFLSVLLFGTKQTLEIQQFDFSYVTKRALLIMLVWVGFTMIYFLIFQSAQLQITILEIASILGYSITLSLLDFPIIKFYAFISTAVHAVKEGVRIVKKAQDSALVDAKQITMWNWIVMSFIISSIIFCWLCMW
ncbi:Yif1 [Spironucleus salmonicida]|uniref:Transmembrane domain-containing protein n=1 Tax=Spironucleus salmonicida TaxID=348837 RepID=V6LSI8_9EUKA|nr:Yif1 [Spironucleus salmonicida]|eukprot:EST47193.1 Transmembrane domain-containing protein [Spironucleus salmonicida]